MTDNNQLTLGAPAPGGLLAIPDGLVVELETKLQLTDEQREKALHAKRMKILHGLTGVARAQAMRELREALVSEDGSGRNGWDSICRSDFETNACDANYEIAGLQAFEAAFSSETRAGQARGSIPAEVGSTHLNEVGRLPDAASRMKLAELVRDAEVRLNKRALRAAANELKSEASKVKLKASAPPKAPGTPKLPSRNPAAGAKKWSVSKWTKDGTPQGDRMDKEFAYLAGTEGKNKPFEEGLTALRRKTSAGKLPKILALAAALHAECKAVSDRYQLENEKARDWKRYMTVWQHHWADTDQLDMADVLKQVTAEMAEASRHFEITGQLSWAADVQLED